MQVLLQHCLSLEYFCEDGSMTRDPQLACVFKSMAEALTFSHKIAEKDVQLVVKYPGMEKSAVIPMSQACEENLAGGLSVAETEP